MCHILYFFYVFIFSFFYKYIFCKFKYIPYTQAHNRHTPHGLLCQAAYTVHASHVDASCIIHLHVHTHGMVHACCRKPACMLQTRGMHASCLLHTMHKDNYPKLSPQTSVSQRSDNIAFLDI